MTGRAMGSHHSARPKTTTWITPDPIVEALGGAESFDLDPCEADNQPWPCAKAGYRLGRGQDGLILPWYGRVWLNPPYTPPELAAFLKRMAEHDRGTALIFARTETDNFHRFVWGSASGALFLRGRLHFCREDGTQAKDNAGAPSVLVAYGMDDLDRLAAADLEGQLVPLNMPRSVMVDALPGTWREIILADVRRHHGPINLGDLYRHLARHPKVKANPNWRAKIRQTLQRGPFEPLGGGVWKEAANA